MNIKIKTRGIVLTDAIEAYVDKKCAGLKKFLSDMPDDFYINVEVGKTTRHHKKGDVFKADANLNFQGKTVYASSEKEDLYAAIDELKDEIASELTKLKEKKQSKIRKIRVSAKEMIKGIK